MRLDPEAVDVPRSRMPLGDMAADSLFPQMVRSAAPRADAAARGSGERSRVRTPGAAWAAYSGLDTARNNLKSDLRRRACVDAKGIRKADGSYSDLGGGAWGSSVPKPAAGAAAPPLPAPDAGRRRPRRP